MLIAHASLPFLFRTKNMQNTFTYHWTLHRRQNKQNSVVWVTEKENIHSSAENRTQASFRNVVFVRLMRSLFILRRKIMFLMNDSTGRSCVLTAWYHYTTDASYPTSLSTWNMGFLLRRLHRRNNICWTFLSMKVICTSVWNSRSCHTVFQCIGVWAGSFGLLENTQIALYMV